MHRKFRDAILLTSDEFFSQYGHFPNEGDWADDPMLRTCDCPQCHLEGIPYDFGTGMDCGHGNGRPRRREFGGGGRYGQGGYGGGGGYGQGGYGDGGQSRGMRNTRRDEYGDDGYPRVDRPRREGGRYAGQGERHNAGFRERDRPMGPSGRYGGGRASEGSGRGRREGRGMPPPRMAPGGRRLIEEGPSRQGRFQAPRGNGRRERAPPLDSDEYEEEEDDDDDVHDDFDDSDD